MNFNPAIFETQKRDFQGDWKICDAHLGWKDNVYEYLYENIGYDWRYQYEEPFPAEFDDYLAKKKPAYFTFEDIETVRSFYCECYEPLRRGFK